MFRTSIRIGDRATVNNEQRVVVDLRRNTAGGAVIIWSTGQSSKPVGGCATYVWEGWVAREAM